MLELVAPELSTEFRNRFRNEAKAAGRLQHPNIGAAEAKLLELGFKREAAAAVFLAPRIEQVREAMQAPAFAIAEEAGRALDHDAALAERRAWLAGMP